MPLTTEENVMIATLQNKNKKTAMTYLGWTEEEYYAWSDNIHKMLNGLSPNELKKFQRKQNKEIRQLSTLLFLSKLTAKTRLPFIYPI